MPSPMLASMSPAFTLCVAIGSAVFFPSIFFFSVSIYSLSYDMKNLLENSVPLFVLLFNVILFLYEKYYGKMPLLFYVWFL